MSSSAKQVPWLRLLAEGAAIVASILLAFVIDAVWDGRLEREEARELLVGLQGEVNDNLAVLAAGLDSLVANQDRLNRFVLSTPDAYSTELGDSAWAAVVRPQYRDFSVTLSYGFLDATIGAAKLELIRDTELRAALAGLHALQETADEPLGALVELGTEAGVILGEYPDVQWGFATQRFSFEGSAVPTLRSLRADQRLVRLAASRTMSTYGYIVGLRTLETQLDQLASMLEAALSGY